MQSSENFAWQTMKAQTGLLYAMIPKQRNKTKQKQMGKMAIRWQINKRITYKWANEGINEAPEHWTIFWHNTLLPIYIQRLLHFKTTHPASKKCGLKLTVVLKRDKIYIENIRMGPLLAALKREVSLKMKGS